jgi:MFS family permease
VIPLTGWAADRFGTKRLYLGSLVLFMVGSALCSVVWSAGSLIAFRVLQGFGGGMIMPIVMTILTRKAGPERMGRVMGLLGMPMLAAPILGGWLVDDVSWRWIFLINIPIGIVAIALLFAIAFFGSLLLIPLYYQTVRGASALEAGLLFTNLYN